MIARYSIDQAKERLYRVTLQVEKGDTVELTRDGERVAVMISIEDYERLLSQKHRHKNPSGK